MYTPVIHCCKSVIQLRRVGVRLEQSAAFAEILCFRTGFAINRDYRTDIRDIASSLSSISQLGTIFTDISAINLCEWH